MLTFQQISMEGGAITSPLQNLGFPLALKYLRDRGIGEELINDLGVKILPAAELIQRARSSIRMPDDDRLAVVFPHFNVKGDYIDWWSARLVDTNLRPVVHSFANLVPHKRGKMFCPPNEAPHAYLVPTLDWTKLRKNDKVYIHESCVKAIAGARLGYWSVGLNGVWGWTSRKHEIALVAELRDLPWKALKLQPVIVFDSNAEDNWDVQSAIGHLTAKILEITGQHATHILLPRAPDGTHWGFDDFAARMGDDAARAYLESEGQTVTVSEVELTKLRLNSEVCVVRSLGRVAEQESLTLMSRSVFTEVNYAHYTAVVEDGEDVRQVNVPRLWLSDTRRTEVERLDYIPGITDRIVKQDGERILNAWRGWGLSPEEGDVSQWLDLLQRNVSDETLRHWIIQWFAYPLQNPGGKLNTFLHLWGPPGTGKNALLEPILRIYGKNAAVCGRDDLSGNFNAILANKQFVNFDELYGGNGPDAVRVTNKLKPIITGDKIAIEQKGVDKYFLRNCMNSVTTANYMDAIKLDDSDRRAAVINIGDQSKKNDKSYWVPYFEHFKYGAGAAALFHYLLAYSLEGFDPKGWAPDTADKHEMIRATQRFDEQWVHMLREDPDQVLPPVLRTRALMTVDELAQYCYTEGTATAGQKNGLGIKLYAAKFDKRELKIDGRKIRFWIIRNPGSEWTPEDCRKHLKSQKYPGIK
jgi:hypothetical protein